MFQKIKQLADDALALQNKDRMDAALREISALCDPEVLRQLVDSVMLASIPASFPFDRAKFNAVPAPDESLPVFLPADAPSGFGLAHIKMEGCAIHPDDTDADMTDEQYAKQLAAHERDIKAGGPPKSAPKAKKGGAK